VSVGGALVLLAGAVPAAHAQDVAGPGYGPGPRGRMGRMGPMGPMGMEFGFRQLGLTDDQRQQVRTIMDRHREDFRSLGERMRTAREAVHAAVTSESPDESAIRTASAALADVQADGAVLRAKVHQEVWAVLTPEQREKAKSLRAEREQRWKERQERVRPRRGNQVQ
jgi:Spy/CpxP family protein refolding chaperone